ncbi:MAG: ATP-dependent 6-phosphofructokinase [Chloroflexota bacterium]|nr:MAG: ATP-dependent 6-phosphofructokinase [Chloroflexota bacterium]
MRIGVLTGGGDCPGLNAAIRAVVRRADEKGWEVTGFLNGWAGLLGEGNPRPLTSADVSGILPLGGTMLGTSRTNPMKKQEHMDQVAANFGRHQIDALVAIGGDDTLSVAARLHDIGLKTVGVPKTMDNDLSETDACIGFNSAVEIVVDALDKLHTTASSHHRVMVVEVMGRDAGWVATVGGLAGGADYILIPEVDVAIETVCDSLRRRRLRGRDSSVVVVSEGAKLPDVEVAQSDATTDAFGHVRLDRRNVGEVAAREIEKRTGFETRVTVLGHLQRGGSPSSFDRVLATRTGAEAVEYIEKGMFGHMAALRGNDIKPVRLRDVVAKTRTVDLDLWRLASTFY